MEPLFERDMPEVDVEEREKKLMQKMMGSDYDKYFRTDEADYQDTESEERERESNHKYDWGARHGL
jgi:hypothetical protein